MDACGTRVPSVAVVMATCRLGGMDVVFPALSAQTFQDFEVVLVDYWYEERKTALRDYLGRIGFDRPLLHRPPETKRIPYGCAAYNLAFSETSADLICILSDFSQAPPGYVRAHRQTYLAFEGKAALIGGLVKIPAPPLRNHITPETACISVFERPWRPHRDALLPQLDAGRQRESAIQLPQEVAGSLPPEAGTAGWGETSWASFYATQHNSLPRWALVATNGFDQDYDGGFGGADLELGVRCMLAGLRFVTHLDSDLMVEVNHHTFPPHLNFTDAPDLHTDRNQRMMEERIPRLFDEGGPVRAENGGFSL